MWTRSKLSEKYQIFQRHPEDILPTTPLKIIIGEDEGGYINKYSEHWRNAAARGTEVDVLGKCQSACSWRTSPRVGCVSAKRVGLPEVRCLTILTDSQRLAHWNWCREFIDREAFDF